VQSFFFPNRALISLSGASPGRRRVSFILARSSRSLVPIRHRASLLSHSRARLSVARAAQSSFHTPSSARLCLPSVFTWPELLLLALTARARLCRLSGAESLVSFTRALMRSLSGAHPAQSQSSRCRLVAQNFFSLLVPTRHRVFSRSHTRSSLSPEWCRVSLLLARSCARPLFALMAQSFSSLALTRSSLCRLSGAGFLFHSRAYALVSFYRHRGTELLLARPHSLSSVASSASQSSFCTS
jgi:hypothetical protein